MCKGRSWLLLYPFCNALMAQWDVTVLMTPSKGSLMLSIFFFPRSWRLWQLGFRKERIEWLEIALQGTCNKPSGTGGTETRCSVTPAGVCLCNFVTCTQSLYIVRRRVQGAHRAGARCEYSVTSVQDVGANYKALNKHEHQSNSNAYLWLQWRCVVI